MATIDRLPNDSPIKKFLLSERPWPRKLRIAKARMELSQAKTTEEQKFWRTVLEAYEGDSDETYSAHTVSRTTAAAE